MDVASLSLGFVTLCLGGLLEFTNRPAQKSGQSQLDQDYLVRQGRQRRSVHRIIFAIGGLAITAGLLGPGLMFVGLWLVILVAIAMVIFFACRDAYQSHQYLKAKLPELRQATLTDTEYSRSDQFDS